MEQAPITALFAPQKLSPTTFPGGTIQQHIPQGAYRQSFQATFSLPLPREVDLTYHTVKPYCERFKIRVRW